MKTSILCLLSFIWIVQNSFAQNPTAKDPTWKNLAIKEWDQANGNKWFKAGINRDQLRSVSGKKYKKTNYIFAHASGSIEYTFQKPITGLKSTLAILDGARKGNVIFIVETDEGEVFRSTPITLGKAHNLDITFNPTNKLILTTNSNGSNAEDWSIWLEPRYRVHRENRMFTNQEGKQFSAEVKGLSAGKVLVEKDGRLFQFPLQP